MNTEQHNPDERALAAAKAIFHLPEEEDFLRRYAAIIANAYARDRDAPDDAALAAAWKLFPLAYPDDILGKAAIIAHHYSPLVEEIAALQSTITACENEVAKVYCELTAGQFSKMNTRAQHIIDRVDELHDAEIADLYRAWQSDRAALGEAYAAAMKELADLRTQLAAQTQIAENACQDRTIVAQELATANQELIDAQQEAARRTQERDEAQGDAIMKGAACAALRDKLAALQHEKGPRWAELQRAETQLAAAKEDGERLDWLEKNAHDHEVILDVGHHRQQRHDTVREAIDAARQEPKP